MLARFFPTPAALQEYQFACSFWHLLRAESLFALHGSPSPNRFSNGPSLSVTNLVSIAQPYHKLKANFPHSNVDKLHVVPHSIVDHNAGMSLYHPRCNAVGK